eukprot:CAMPEP_0170112186 /NCGR_PEP_ID=MMETSP0020_2-20130122/8967_1 /TAXON_ID=98059 /ORGANISM="Dinobryon sp., Strain UTEXLB2267" /LENGTH=51 /DNA_ID=CAMNT_0010337951 /DNA_START=657 /DNA_END=812 /DNA_ORIENTATION=+
MDSDSTVQTKVGLEIADECTTIWADEGMVEEGIALEEADDLVERLSGWVET